MTSTVERVAASTVTPARVRPATRRTPAVQRITVDRDPISGHARLTIRDPGHPIYVHLLSELDADDLWDGLAALDADTTGTADSDDLQHDLAEVRAARLRGDV